LTDRDHLLLVAAVALLAVQCWFNSAVGRIEGRVVEELLDLGVRFLVAHSTKSVRPSDFRGTVHLVKRCRPGARLPLQRCLVPIFWRSPVPPRDFGAIPLDADSFKTWYVNVKAFHQQRVVCLEPTMADRPSADGHYVATPSLFPAKAVISAPLWSRTNPPTIIGTLTFDSLCPSSDVDWCNNGAPDDAVQDMVCAMANVVSRLLGHEEESR
jgi:hypothetical protein